MFLSRISIAPGSADRPAVWRTFASSYRLHQAIWELFADSPDRRRDFLYRVEDDGPRPKVYTLSAREPVGGNGLWKMETKPFRPVLRAGELLDFSLRANPVATRDGKRHDVVMDAKKGLEQGGVPRAEWPPMAALVQEHGGRWLVERAGSWGVVIPGDGVRVDRYQPREFRKPSGRKVRIATCDFEGTLEVAEPDRFLASLVRGYGPAKGFGCGLMLCKRHR